MAHKKAGGSTALGRDSISKRLGVKVSDGEFVQAGEILVRQRGTKFHIGKNVKYGKDWTIYAAKEGTVKFFRKKLPKFNGKLKWTKIVEVIPKKI